MRVDYAPSPMVALDARTGQQIWRYQRQQKVVNPYEINPFNRGVAVLGNRVFFGTLERSIYSQRAPTQGCISDSFPVSGRPDAWRS